jgi:Family of unknown function (DUF6226)
LVEQVIEAIDLSGYPTCEIHGQNCVVTTAIKLLAAVEVAFEITRRGLAEWPDPHPDRSPHEDEYSRLVDPGKWRIVGARFDAWVVALVDAGLAVVERDASVHWHVEHRMVISRTDRIVPFMAGALPVVIARTQLGDIGDAGVVLAVGDPAVRIETFPDCGCDACDSGSKDELDRLDTFLHGVVGGLFRRLSAGDREITVTGEGEWSATGDFGRREVDSILADPRGWDEVAGKSWLSPS